MTARSRSTGRWRDGGAAPAARRGSPAARPATASSATITRSRAQVELGDDVRVELADPADEPSPPASDRARPGPDAGSGRRRSGVRDGAGKPEPAAEQLEQALRVVEVVRPRRGRFQAGCSAAPRERQAEPPPLVRRRVVRRRRSPCRPRRRRRPRGRARWFVDDDLEQAADQALAEDRVLRRQRVGDDDRPAAGTLPGLALERTVVVRREALDHPRSDEREGHGLADAGARRASRGRRRAPRADRGGRPASACPAGVAGTSS